MAEVNIGVVANDVLSTIGVVHAELHFRTADVLAVDTHGEDVLGVGDGVGLTYAAQHAVDVGADGISDISVSVVIAGDAVAVDIKNINIEYR